MNLLNKIKNALFEEEEEETEQEIVKKIDVEKTVSEEPEIKIRHYEEPVVEEEKPKERITPVIFDVDDFVEEEPVSYRKEYQKPIQKEQKIIYGGYVSDERINDKTKFKPTPIISPVYGIINPNEETPSPVYNNVPESKTLDGLFMEEKKKTTEMDLDAVREKAFGLTKEQKVIDLEEDKALLYEMEDVNDKPAIDKISIGDAEEYFEDLGLEYNVDYKDVAKEKMTRTKKNKDLTEEVDEEIKENKKIEQEMLEQKENDVSFEAEEKNLYDLIDLMYDSKE